MRKRVRLKRELGIFHVTVAGVGIILGAGIYALIGVAAGETGNSMWLSFLIATVVAAFTGLSYAELSSIFKGDAGEHDYIETAMGKFLAFIVALFIIFTGVVGAATVSLGFAGYLASIIPINFLLGALGLIAIMSLINYKGIKDSNRFNVVATTIEFLGLLIIIILGVFHVGEANIVEMPNGVVGLFKASALLFFAFMGFESIVKLREEAKNPEKTIPKAIVLSLIITAVVYVLVSIAAVSILPAGEIANSESPLADVAAVKMGALAFIVLGVIALFSTSNTALLMMLTTSRLIYGMSNKGSLPRIFSRVGMKRRTPYIAIFVVGIVTALFALVGNIKLIADITTALLFATFALVNLSTIILRYKLSEKRTFKMPVNIGKFPVLALLGVVTSLIMLVFSFINIF